MITGNDFPIKPLPEFKSFFSENNHTNYLEYYILPRHSWPNEGGIGRIRYFWIGNQWCDIRKHSRITNFLLKIQRKFNIKRRFLDQFPTLYGGGTYWSLKEDAIAILNNNYRLLRSMRWTHCAEEVFIHSILLNKADESCFENNSKRFIKWGKHAQSPRVLSDADLGDIVSSDAFFARKMDVVNSNVLLDHFLK